MLACLNIRRCDLRGREVRVRTDRQILELKLVAELWLPGFRFSPKGAMQPPYLLVHISPARVSFTCYKEFIGVCVQGHQYGEHGSEIEEPNTEHLTVRQSTLTASYSEGKLKRCRYNCCHLDEARFHRISLGFSRAGSARGIPMGRM